MKNNFVTLDANSIVSAGTNTISGTTANINNCGSTSCTVYNCQWCKPIITYTPYYSGYTFYANNVSIRKVENGYIVNKDGKEFVITEKKDLLKYIE